MSNPSLAIKNNRLKTPTRQNYENRHTNALRKKAN